MQNIFFKTFGCRTNIYDTQVMKSGITDFIIVHNENDAQTIIVNSCTVTNGADTSVRQYIHKMQKQGKKVIVAGCGAISKGKELFDAGKINGVLGHSQKDNLNQLLKKESFFELGNLDFIDKNIVTKFNKQKAFIKIQEGCDFNCSYCIIPSVRGRSRSQKQEVILEQIKTLVDNGFSEFVLTGTNIGSYTSGGLRVKGSGFRDGRIGGLGGLLKAISLIRGVKRVRLGSIEPSQIDDEFKEVLKEPILERHLHIALQHTNEEMLKIMRRRNNYKNDLELFEYLSSEGFALGTDYIVGHPGENEQRYQDGKEKLQNIPLTHIHLFTYSKRDGTHAATMKDTINGKIANQRLKQLEQIVSEKNYNFRKQNSHIPLKVFIEDYKENHYIGYDQFFNTMHLKSDENLKGKWVGVERYDVLKNGNYGLIG